MGEMILDITFVDPSYNNNSVSGGKEYKEKQYKCRMSLITELLNGEKTKGTSSATVFRNVLIIIGIVVIIKNIVHEYTYEDRITLGMELPIIAFRNFPIAFLIWLVMVAVVSLNFTCFHLWRKYSKSLLTDKKYTKRKLWDGTWIFLLIAYYAGWACLPLYCFRIVPFGVLTKMSLIGEQIRLAMKMHSYIRYNIKYYISMHDAKGDDKPIFSLFLKFHYFLLAPTLLYRHKYPMSPHRSWTYIISCCLEFGFILYFLLLLYKGNFIELYKDFGKEHISWVVLISNFLQTVISSYFIFLLSFYNFLHVWLNMWAEFLRFGDRRFYKDWWTAKSMSEYFPMWNYVVYDWLVEYIYADLTQIFSKGTNKIVARLCVIFVSAVFHQYLLSASVGSLLPIHFMSFMGSIILYHNVCKMSNTFANLLLHLCICIGTTVIINVHYMEYYARMHCSSLYEDNDIMDFVMPRLLTCFPNVTSVTV